MAINQINELQQEIERLNQQIAGLTRDLQVSMQQNENLKELYGTERNKRLATLAQASEAMAKAKELEKELKASTSRAKMRDAEARAEKAEKLEEENIELQVKLEQEAAIKKDVVGQLRTLNQITMPWGDKEISGKTARKLVEHKNKTIETQQKEIEGLVANIDTLYAKLERSESQYWLNDIDLIFKGFGIDYGVKLEKGERQDLYNAVKVAKKIDSSNNKKKQEKRATEGYDAIIEKLVEQIRETRLTDAGKNFVSKEGVVALLEQSMDKPNAIRAFIKQPLWVKLLAGAALLAVIGGIVWAIVANVQSQKAEKTANAEKELAELFAQLDANQAKTVANIIANYGIVLDNEKIAQLLEEGRNEDNAKDFDKIENAVEIIGNLVALGAPEEISEDSEVGQNVKNYIDAKNNGDIDGARYYLGQLVDQMNEIRETANNSTEATRAVLGSLGLTSIDDVDAYLAWQEAQKNPIINVQVNDEDVAEYSDYLVSNGAAFGGAVKEVKFVRYEKKTGEVTIFTECQSNYAQDYINVIKFNMDKNETDVTFDEVMGKAKTLAATNNIKSVPVFASTVVEDEQGNRAYSVVNRAYNAGDDTTTITTHLIIVTADNQVKEIVEQEIREGQLNTEQYNEAKLSSTTLAIIHANAKFNIKLNQFGGPEEEM